MNRNCEEQSSHLSMEKCYALVKLRVMIKTVPCLEIQISTLDKCVYSNSNRLTTKNFIAYRNSCGLSLYHGVMRYWSDLRIS